MRPVLFFFFLAAVVDDDDDDERGGKGKGKGKGGAASSSICILLCSTPTPTPTLYLRPTFYFDDLLFYNSFIRRPFFFIPFFNTLNKHLFLNFLVFYTTIN